VSPYVTGSIAAEVLTKGDPKRGAEVFRNPAIACLTCHRVGKEGGLIGPALDALGSAQPLEFIIGTVIEPQREVKEGFETVRLTTKKGQELIGIIVAGNDSELILRDAASAEHTVAQADVAKREFIGSLMPAVVFRIHSSGRDTRARFWERVRRNFCAQAKEIPASSCCSAASCRASP
jgi:putative heme-binding domain-containing protein